MQGSSILPTNKFNKPQNFNSTLTANAGVLFTNGASTSGFVWTLQGTNGSGAWQVATAGGGGGGVSGISITGQSLISGNISLIPSGTIQLAYSGNNIIIGSPVPNSLDGVLALNITGGSQISGNIGLIPSGDIKLGYSGNNFVIGVSSTLFNITTVTGGSYTALSTDSVIEFNVPSGSSGQCILPNGLPNGTHFVIKDGTGFATFNPIHVSGFPNIDNTGVYILNQSWDAISVYKSNGGWRIY